MSNAAAPDHLAPPAKRAKLGERRGRRGRSGDDGDGDDDSDDGDDGGAELQVQQWVACDKCSKWRRVPCKADKSNTFLCTQLSGGSCDLPEDRVFDDEHSDDSGG